MKEAMTVLGETQPTLIRRLVETGDLVPAHKMPGQVGAYLFHRSDIEKLAKARISELEARVAELKSRVAS